jgi:predicted small lipoprotein YifL
MNRIKLLLFFCALAVLATACGQRGPLYLPEPETRQDAPPATTDTEEKKNEENSGT